MKHITFLALILSVSLGCNKPAAHTISVKFNQPWKPDQLKSCGLLTGRSAVAGVGQPVGTVEMDCYDPGEDTLAPLVNSDGTVAKRANFAFAVLDATVKLDPTAEKMFRDSKKWLVYLNCTRTATAHFQCQYDGEALE